MSTGFLKLYNRSEADFEFVFDTKSYIVPAKDSIVVNAHVARFARSKSNRLVNLDTNKGYAILAIEGVHDTGDLPEGVTGQSNLVDHEAMGQEIVSVVPENDESDKEQVTI